MTNMKRVTISFPDEIDAAICELQAAGPYKGATYATIVRDLIIRGLDVAGDNAERDGAGE